MCGRYELHTHPAVIALAFGLAHPPEISPRYNIAPMQTVPIVRVNAAGERELVQMRWGLVPRWAREPSIGAKMINARGETVATRASFRIPYRRHRCLLPADGFYEWQPLPEGRKQPMLIGMRDGRPFGLAGIYERWLGPDGEPLDSCAILTTRANEMLSVVHDRMPVIVPPEVYARWLDPEEPDPAELIAPFPSELMRARPVSTRVNNVKNEDAACIEPLADDIAAEAVDAAPPDAGIAADDEPAQPTQAKLF